ncbi:hypothetical protein [Gluconacetobacter tumulisoli]|uniref:Uncharacterized protein n=1 Tax=Gluconacetobacter tumulisoli TaxID=1286189 RepID=A0A7W4PM36_9PROT|nr:hypothetical protein [Gluconacetobacter tumulisoli]MBB2202568.1 hypothetical protein [Gluconacetobacter tumulisoli]
MTKSYQARSGRKYVFDKIPSILLDAPAIVWLSSTPEDDAIAQGNIGDVFLFSDSLGNDQSKILVQKSRYDFISEVEVYVLFLEDGTKIDDVSEDFLGIEEI